MSLFLGNYHFEGPFDSINQIEEKEGVFAVLCKTENEISQLIHIEEAKNIKKRIRNHINSIKWPKLCNGNIVFGANYTPDVQEQDRQSIVNEIIRTNKIE